MNAIDIVNDMRLGISIGNSLDAFKPLPMSEPSHKFETAWYNPVITKELVDSIIRSGMDIVRIPVTWTNHFGEAPDYRITDDWMNRVKEVVDYAYCQGVYVIINVHHEGWNHTYYDNCEKACAIMGALWKQIAEAFTDYDYHLIFEGQNEPRKVATPLEWNGGDKEGWDVVNATNKAFVQAVRSVGGNNAGRLLMIPGYAANCTVGIRHIEIPDNCGNIAVSVHAYEPYEFALDGKGRSAWNNDTDKIDSIMKDIKELFTDKGIPAIIGEFGAVDKNNEDDRIAWTDYYVRAAAKIGVPCIWWDNGVKSGDGEIFSFFDRVTYECRYPRILEALLDAAK